MLLFLSKEPVYTILEKIGGDLIMVTVLWFLSPTLRPTMDEHLLLDVTFDLESLSVELKQTISVAKSGKVLQKIDMLSISREQSILTVSETNEE